MIHLRKKISFNGNVKKSKNISKSLFKKYPIVLIVTNHSKFNYKFISKNAKYLFDSRNTIKNKKKIILKFSNEQNRNNNIRKNLIEKIAWQSIKKIEKTTIIELIISRIKKSNLKLPIIINTSTNKSDNDIVKLCKKKIKLF